MLSSTISKTFVSTFLKLLVLFGGFLLGLDLLGFHLFVELVLEHLGIVGGFSQLVRRGGELHGRDLDPYLSMGR